MERKTCALRHIGMLGWDEVHLGKLDWNVGPIVTENIPT